MLRKGFPAFKIAHLPVILFTLSPAVLAQQPALSWDAVEQATGKSIVVVRNDNHSHTGKLEQVSGDSLTLADHERKIVIPRGDIRQVHWRTGRSRKRGALWGLAIGAGSGAIVGAAGTQPCDACIISISRGEGAAVGATAGAAVGTIVGVLVGGGRKQVLLYDSSASIASH
ncbi:MAG TPA: hypothetical protein VNX88_08575 [Terriglobales bacterium]|nr:hypothetical protein [Terriglobales bacterium]